MPRQTVERERRDALVEAAIGAIEDAGSLDVTMAMIAKRACVSPALAHHYFGGKDDLMFAAMRRLLKDYRAGVTERLKREETPRGRLSAILAGSFDPVQFSGETIAAWLVFYLHARRSARSARLLAIYFRRLESNLVADLVPLTDRERARTIASAVGAMIDGLWLRQALRPGTAPDGEAAVRLLERFLNSEIGHENH